MTTNKEFVSFTLGTGALVERKEMKTSTKFTTKNSTAGTSSSAEDRMVVVSNVMISITDAHSMRRQEVLRLNKGR